MGRIDQAQWMKWYLNERYRDTNIRFMFIPLFLVKRIKHFANGKLNIKRMHKEKRGYYPRSRRPEEVN